ncbi:MAG: molybdopterin-dependent oxidoreductase [Betaproteobacteria bacterium]|nr:molybdopterin-dependent oxidoreductase [Betaproteobacteria bacterium]
MRETRSTCCYCGVGCGVIVESEGQRITGVRGDPDHPANFGRLCTKGATLHLSTAPSLRALQPELRLARNAPRRAAAWDEALELCAARFADVIRRHGPDAVAFYVSGQLLTEDYYVFNKLAKGLIGTNNIDTNSRLCMSSAVAGYKLTLGADAPPACYDDIDAADCLFIAGSNTAFAHPVMFRRIEDARRARPDMKIIVVDPRRTDTAEAADLHLAILPGTDIALFNAMLHVMLWEGLTDARFIREHTAGFDALKEAVRETTPGMAAQICGVAEQDIITAARWFGGSAATLSLYCQGLNQSAHGTHNNAALINLHLATGHIGRPGAGPFSLTGQPNAMGGREVGGMANLLCAHRDLANPQHRAEVAQLWGVPAVPETPGKTAVELFDALRSGEVKAVWIACTNPAQSLPDLGAVHEALARAEFVVLQEAFRDTETADFADVLLPATTWGEKEGTLTNSERRISHVRAAVPAPGQARADWRIAVDFAQRLGQALDDDGGARGKPAPPGRADEARRLFPYDTPEHIFAEHRESTRGRDLDITGLSYALLDERGPQQWPFPEGAANGTARLYTDGRFATADGRARFVVVRHQGVAEPTDARYPLHLTTGRLRDQWHGMSRTGKVARLFSHEGEPLLHVHPADLERRAIADGALVRLASRRGALLVRVVASDVVRPGQLFMPMHWGGQFMAGGGANRLTLPATDPISRQPELKHCAVRMEAFTPAHEVVVLRRAARGGTDGAGLHPHARHETGSLPPGGAAPALGRPGDGALAFLEAARPWLRRFDYASLGLAGREVPVVVLRAGGTAPASDDPQHGGRPSWLLSDLDRDFGLGEAAQTLTFADARRNVAKRALVEDDRLVGVRLVGETVARPWLTDWIAREQPARPVRQWLLAPVAQPPSGQGGRGRVVCNCHDVAEDEILAACRAGADLPGLQARLGCGTSCGSCLPEVRRLLASAAQAA